MHNKKIKNLVFNADDFGMSIAFNEGVRLGIQQGFLTSASLCANGEAFDHAIRETLPQCQNMGIGVHLNIIEGKSIRKNISESSLLCSNDGIYKHGFLSFLANSKNKKLLQEIEDDFRSQIELILKYTKVDHIDSHVHIHGIPVIFEIVCKLANEYNISFVRFQRERFYIIPSFLKHLNLWYPLNLVKIAILNTTSGFNTKVVRQYNMTTPQNKRINDYLIGIGYTGFMDSQTIEYGLNAIKDKNCIAEILIHPCYFGDSRQDPRYIEFQTTQDINLLNKIKDQGWNLTNYSFLAQHELQSFNTTAINL